MARFKSSKKQGAQNINTASLPDIIFMLLFFFMVTTVMREVTLIVKVLPPEATEVEKLERKSLVSYIYIGEPKRVVFGTKPRIQLNDAFGRIEDIPAFVTAERQKRDEAERRFITTSLKVDQNIRMGIVTDVKQELRKAGAFKINYSTRKVRSIDFGRLN
ncbi:MAG TPA: biopolymer transporter ExbD [Bacteroidales bacterium]|nr:biopolymer transporter ExbD [Bacteroidales bacterium]